MKRNHFLSLLLVLAMMLSTVSLCIIPAAAEGASDTWDGTADTTWYNDTDTTFTLTTAEQLAGLASIVNAGTDTFAGKTVALGADLILNKGTVTDGAWTPAEGDNSKQWTPIGTETAPFSGTFDGKGHTISGLYYHGSLIYAGLFGVIENAILSNINVGIGYLRSSGSSGTKLLVYSMGTVVAYATSSTVQNCINYANLDYRPGQTEYCYAGGMIGYVRGASSVIDCVNRGDVYAENWRTGGGSGMYVGGIVGGFAAPTLSDGTVPTALMTGCINYAKLTGNINNGNPYGNFGGIAGTAMNVKIAYCINYGEIKVDSTRKLNAGGIIGATQGGLDMSYCFNYGELSACHSAGGIIGMARDLNSSAGISYVHDCINYGAVNGDKYAGGIVGDMYNNSGRKDSYYYGNVNYGDVTGYLRVAGLYIISRSNSFVYLRDSVNYGNVTAVVADAATVNVYVGGAAVVSTSMNRDKLTNCINLGNVEVRTDLTEIPADWTGNVAAGLCFDVEGNNASYSYYSAAASLIVDPLLQGFTTTPADAVGKREAVTVAQLNGSDIETNVNGKAGMLAGLAANKDTKVTWVQGKTAPMPYYAAALEIQVYAASVTLGDKVAVNLYVENAGAAAALDYTLTVDGQKLVGTDTADGKYTVYTVADIDAKDLLKNYEITLTVPTEDGTDVITTDTLTYGVSKYIDRMSGKGNDKLDALLAALSDYAKAAAGESVDVDEAYDAVELVPVENVDATYATAIALVLTDSIRPVIKVADGVAQVTVAIYGETYTYAVVDGEVIIDCLTATSLNNEMVLSFLDAEGNVLGTTAYSVANYIKSVEDLDLAKALAVYMQAARAYNGLN